MSDRDPVIRNRGRGYGIGNGVKGDGKEERGGIEFISRLYDSDYDVRIDTRH